VHATYESRVLNLAREKDPETLRTVALLLERENKRLLQTILRQRDELAKLKGLVPEDLQQRLAWLEQQLALDKQARFGASSEKREGGAEGESTTPAAAESETAAAETPKDKPTPKGHGPKSQPRLPIIPVPHDLDEADKVCTQCGGELEEWEGKEESRDEITAIERSFVVHRHLRKKYRCRCGACVQTAPSPPRLPGTERYSIDFALHVALNKYLDHMPLERQVRGMARDGLETDTQTLWDQLDALARVLSPLHTAAGQYVLSHPVVGVDETHWKLVSRKNKDGAKTSWQLWVLIAGNVVCYKITDGRGTHAANTVLEGYLGTVMCDGLNSYKAVAKLSPKMKLAHCMAHLRRKFVQIEAFYPKECGEVLALLGRLYAAERGIPAGPEGDGQRLLMRAEKSAGIIKELQAWALRTEARPGTRLRDAIDYLADHWRGLTRFLSDPRVPLDNNHSERSLRGPVVGRKNSYLWRSRRGAEVSALLYTLIESCKLAKVDPRKYLRMAVHSFLAGEEPPLPHAWIPD
jgi:transposase